MPQNRSIELRVGIFLAVCLVIGAGLILRFSKQAGSVKNAYHITVMFPSVSGIVPEATVQYAGIPVGKVARIQLHEDGAMKVALSLAIVEGVVIRQDAQFSINTSGLLGDKYVDVQPGTAGAEPLKDGDQVSGLPSADLSETIANVRTVLQNVTVTIGRVDQALQRLDKTVLSQETLDHVRGALANVDQVSTNTIELVAGLRDLVGEQRAEVALAIHNVQLASSNLTVTTQRINTLVQANEPQISQVFSNLNTSTERINGLLAALQRGEGTAGRILVDPTLHDELVRLVQNWRKFGLLYKEGSASQGRLGRGAPATPARPVGQGGSVEFGTDLTR